MPEPTFQDRTYQDGPFLLKAGLDVAPELSLRRIIIMRIVNGGAVNLPVSSTDYASFLLMLKLAAAGQTGTRAQYSTKPMILREETLQEIFRSDVSKALVATSKVWKRLYQDLAAVDLGSDYTALASWQQMVERSKTVMRPQCRLRSLARQLFAER